VVCGNDGGGGCETMRECHVRWGQSGGEITFWTPSPDKGR